MSSDAGGKQVGCHEPLCHEDADQLAYDEKFGLNIGFCDEHAPKWLAQDHITEAEA